MRIWSLHPRHLDAKGLVALWREALLARAVLVGQTKGYRSHPQLLRFREQPDPLAAIDAYLFEVLQEASRRGYRFDASKVGPGATGLHLEVTEGQMELEWAHLRAKLAVRAPEVLKRLEGSPEAHPLFRIVPGPRAPWERA